MAVSKEAAYVSIATKVAQLTELMVHDYGRYTSNQWLLLIQKSKLYQEMMDLRTHTWSEGLMYLQDRFVAEIKNTGGI